MSNNEFIRYSIDDDMALLFPGMIEEDESIVNEDQERSPLQVTMASNEFIRYSIDNDMALLFPAMIEEDESILNEEEDSLDKIFPSISKWSAIHSDLFSQILPKAIDMYHPSIQRAKGPPGCLADRLRSAMFNGKQISNKCFSLLFFYIVPSYYHLCGKPFSFFPKRLRECILRDRRLVREAPYVDRDILLEETKLRKCPFSFQEDTNSFLVGVESKVVYWSLMDRRFVYILNVDYNLEWRFFKYRSCLKLPKHFLKMIKNDFENMSVYVIGHRILMRLASDHQVLHAALNVRTLQWIIYRNEFDMNWEQDTICFVWNERFYTWSRLAKRICYLDLHEGKWVRKGTHLKNLRRTLTQLHKMLRIGKPWWDLMRVWQPSLIVSSKTGTLFCIDLICKPKDVGHNLVYAMSDINRGWKAVAIFQDTESVYDCPLRTHPEKYNFEYYSDRFLSILDDRENVYTQRCWAAGEDSIILLLYKKVDRRLCSWFRINEEGIQEYNDLNMGTDGGDKRLTVFVQCDSKV